MYQVRKAYSMLNQFLLGKPGDSLSYYRKDGIHYVPKLQVKDLLFFRSLPR